MPNALRAVAAAVVAMLAFTAPAALAAVPADGATSGPASAHLGVVLFTLPSATSLGIAPADVRATYFGASNSVAQFYRDASNGTFNLSGDLVGPYALSGVDDSSCNVNDWADAARAAATSAGVDLSAYSNLAFVFPWVAVCPWAGTADVNGPDSFLNGLTAGSMGVYHAAHEFGHNLGSGHAHALHCAGDGTPEAIGPSSDCSGDEYGDPFSVMGSGVTRLPNGWERAQMGFLPASAQQVVAGAGTWRIQLAPLEQATGTRLVRVQRADGSFLDLEYRQPFGTFDNYAASDPAVRGITLELVPAGGTAETSLLDATPQTGTFDDATLTAGRSLTDADGGISVSLINADSTGATLDLTVIAKQADPGADTTAPLAPTGLAATVNATSVDLAWQPALDDVAATTYRVSRDGQLVGQTRDRAFADPGASGATHTYSVVAVDAAGNVGPPAQLQVLPPDTVAPSRAGGLTVTRRTAMTALLAWKAATDNVGVARYRVQVDGHAAVTTTQLSLTLRSFRRGTHRIVVWALDAAGNVGYAARLTSRS